MPGAFLIDLFLFIPNIYLFLGITIKVKVKRGHRFVKVKKTIPIRSFTPKGRAKKTIKIKLIESCNGATKTVVLSIKFDKHGQVNYKQSDLNGDGRPDGGKLNDLNGFV